MNDNDYGLRDVLGLIRRQYRLILLMIVLVLGTATAATFTMKPIYSASAYVMVDTSNKNILAPDSGGVAYQDSSLVDSEVELVASDTVLRRVLADEDLIELPEFGIQPSTLDSLLYTLRIKQPVEPTPDDLVDVALGTLANSISVARVGYTYLITVSARSANPGVAARIANAVAKAYVEEQLASKINVILSASTAIQARITEANKSVAASEDAFDTFISTNLDEIAASTGRTDLIAVRTELENMIKTGATLASQVQAGADSAANQDWDALATALRDDAIAKLAADRARLEASLESTSTNTDSLRDQLSKIDAQLQAQASASLTTLRAQLADTQSKAGDLRKTLRTDVLSADLPADTLASIYAMQQSAEIARTQYQTLLARSKDLETQAYLQVPDSRIVSSALPPGAPTFPNKRLILTIAGIIGLIGGVGVALLYENVIGGYTSPEQLSNVARVSVPATIPRQPDLKNNGNPPSLTLADYLVAAPLSAYSESIRRLRVGVDQAVRRAKTARGESPEHAVIMVTSAAPGEGKTTTALALARAYATSGNTTLLVDCDLRKPSLHRQLGVEPSVGLLEYLAQPGEGRSLRSIVTTDTVTGVQVVVGARQSEIATDQFVTGQSFARLIAAARQSFDVVILDTPPVGPVVDGLYMAAYVDAIAVLVRFGKTPQREVHTALRSLNDAKAPSTEILAVLNQADIRSQPYSGAYGEY